MAIAYDAVAIPSAALYTATFSWTHTPVGTPKGVAVVVVQEGSTDQVSGVKYGAVAMTRVRSDVRTATEPGRVYIYFLGSSIPTGAQTIQVTLTGTADTNAVSLTVTATANTSVNVSNGLDAGIIANPSLSLVTTAAAVIFYGIFSGLAAPVTTVETGSTHVAGKDYGTDSAMWARRSVATAGTWSIGYTAASDDVCHSALAIKEGAAQTFYQSLPAIAIGVGTLTRASSFYRTLPAVAVGSATLTKANSFYRTLGATAVGTPILNKRMYLTLNATAIGQAVLTTAKMFSKVLAAVAQGVATLTTTATYVRVLNVVAQGVGSLSRIVTYKQVLVATASGVSTLAKIATHYITLAASATGVSQLLKGISKTLSATAVGVSTLVSSFTASRTLAATATGQAVLTKAKIVLVNVIATAQGIAGLTTQFISGGVSKMTRWFYRR